MNTRVFRNETREFMVYGKEIEFEQNGKKKKFVVGSYTFEKDGVKEYLRVTFTQDSGVTLQKGWNLVKAPLKDMSVKEVKRTDKEGVVVTDDNGVIIVDKVLYISSAELLPVPQEFLDDLEEKRAIETAKYFN